MGGEVFVCIFVHVYVGTPLGWFVITHMRRTSMFKHTTRIIEAVESHSPTPFKIAVKAVDSSRNLLNSNQTHPLMPTQLPNHTLDPRRTSEPHQHPNMSFQGVERE